MYSLRKFNGRTGNIGQPLPDVFPSFALARITFRQGATSMIAGPPGSFKSVTALNLMVSWAMAGKSILYFSADSDEFTVAKRVCGILTGDDSDTFEANANSGHVERYESVLASLDQVQFVYKQPDMDSIGRHVAAFEAVHGAYPDVIFVDNLIDTVEDPTDWGGMIAMIRDLDGMARETQAHICILHHASEEWSKSHPSQPPPSWAIQGKVTQLSRLVLTVANSGMALYLACVKNTNGPQDREARVILQFLVGPNMRVEDVSFRRDMR